jgi:hypothetical protein
MAAPKAKNQLDPHFFDLSIAQCIDASSMAADSGFSAA